MQLDHITSMNQCVSREERRQRVGVVLSNMFLWLVILLLILVSWGIVLLLMGVNWIIQHLLSGYNVRKIQALGATVSSQQFPEVAEAAAEVARRFGIRHVPQIVVISSGETNAFSMKFAKKKIILILSELLESMLDQPNELRALIGHEMCHAIMDHGARGAFELYKPARYKAARELTCDNVGFVAAGDLQSAKDVLKKLCVGKRLYQRVSEEALIDEARDIYAGLPGWLVRRHLSHPPAGARLANLIQFSQDG